MREEAGYGQAADRSISGIAKIKRDRLLEKFLQARSAPVASHPSQFKSLQHVDVGFPANASSKSPKIPRSIIDKSIIVCVVMIILFADLQNSVLLNVFLNNTKLLSKRSFIL